MKIEGSMHILMSMGGVIQTNTIQTAFSAYTETYHCILRNFISDMRQRRKDERKCSNEHS